MFDEPAEDPSERLLGPESRAKEKADELRLHAELAAVFEGGRKFDAQIVPGLDGDRARDIQRGMGKLEKAKLPDTPVIGEPAMPQARDLLDFHKAHDLSTNDYHVHRRPGETMIVRWLEGEQVESYYERLQAHMDAALEGFREDERQALEWKSDDATKAYLDALDKVQVKMAERYLRDFIRQHRLFVLSIQTADELNISYLTDHLMSVPASEVVGARSAPPDGAEESDLAWFYKLFLLRGMVEGVEKMCFFCFLQKTDDSFDFDE